MKIKQLLVLTLVAVLSCQSQGNSDKQKASPDTVGATVELIADEKLKVLTLTGTPYERGFQHGKLLKNEIKAVTDSLLIDIGETTNENPREYIKKFLKETDFVSAMKKWTPGLLEEIKGISAGSGIAHDIIFMHQLGDEFFFSTKYLFAHKCSSIGINKNGQHPTIAAQNMDIPTYFHGYQTVMRIIEDGKAALILTIPGHIGITGMNKASVSINCNILMQLESQSKGLPVSSIVRGVLEKTNYTEAVNWVKTVEHASGQNYIIGGKERMLSLECSASAIEEFKPFDEATFTYHTNHPMANENYSDWYLEALEGNGFTLFDAQEFCQRIPSFEKRFNQKTKDFGIAEIKEVLSSKDHDGVDVLSNSYTYASVIYVLAEKPNFIIAPGKPHETGYIQLRF